MMDRLLREGNPPTGQLASPKPQYKKPGVNEYEPVEGQHGAPFAILKDASGAVVSPATEATLEQVRALLSGVATEAKLEQARTLLDAISTKDFATSSKQDALNIAVEDLKSELILIKSELANIKANQLSGDQKVQLSGTIPPLVKIYERSFDSQSGINVDHCYAENVLRSDSAGIIPLDVSNYKEGYVKYSNNTDQTRRFFIYSLFTTSKGVAGVGSTNYLNSISMRPELIISVPAGTTIYLSPKRYGDGESNVDELNLGCVGFAFRLIWANQSDVTTGTERLIAIFK